jgi:O-antigen/teichoic acid export membrane protein
VLAGLRYDSAIMVAGSQAQAASLARLVMLLGLCTGALAFMFGWPALIALAKFPLGSSALLAALASAYLIGNCALRIATNWLVRQVRFVWVGALQFIAVSLTVASQLILLAIGVDPLAALASGFAFGQVAGAIFIFVTAASGQSWIGHGRRRELNAVARRFISFPRYMVLYGLNSALRERLVYVVIGWGAGAAALGKFAMVQRMVGAPHAFMHGGIGPTLLSHARDVSRDEAARMAASLVELSGLVLTPFIIFLMFNAEQLARSFFGTSWIGLGAYVPWLALTYLVLACTGFIDRLFELYGNQRVALNLDFVFTVVMLGGLLIAGKSSNGLVMTATFGFIYLIYEIYWTLVAHRANSLPLHALKRAGLVFAFQIVFWSVVCALLLFVSILSWRVSIVSLLIPIVFIAHYRWLGGRDVVRSLFSPSGVLA